MNKIFKGVVLSLLAVAGLASCSSNDYSYSPAEVPTNAQVFFPVSNTSSFTLSDDAETINIPIKRGKTDEAVTVNLLVKVAQKASAFTIPASVSFAAGEADAVIPVNYDPTQMEYESKDTISIIIGDETFTTPYGNSVQKLFVTLPSPLKLLGTGTFEDTWVWGGKGKVQIYQNKLNPNEYRIMNPWEAVLTAMAEEAGKDPADYLAELNGRQSPYINIIVMQPGNTLGDVTITQKDLIYYGQINSGYYNTSNDYNQDILLLHPSSFTSLSTESSWLYNRVIEWQENGLPGRIQIAPYFYMNGIGGWNYTQKDGIITIDFPGYTPKDFTAELTYAGIFTDVSSQVYAVGNLTLGADATDVKAVVMPADVDAGAVADAIAAGELEATSVAGGRIEVAIPEDLTGKLQLIVVVIDEGAVKNVVSAPFEYYGGEKNPWKSLGTDGVYYDDFVVPFATGYAYGPWPVQVEVEEHSETPGLYRVKAMYAGVAAAFDKPGGEKEILIHAENPNTVYFLTQPTGLDLGAGEYSIVSYGGDDIEYFGQQGYSAEVVINAFPEDFGTLKDGVITLPIIQRTDSEGNPMYDGEGNPRIYQGFLYQGSDGYYACINGGFQLILPGADPAAAAKAKRAAAAANFEYRLNGGAANMMKVSKKESLKRHHRLAFDFSK